MRHFDVLHYTAQLDLFVAPVKLAGVARLKDERDKGFGQLRAMVARFPAFNEALYAVIGTAVADFLQSFKEPMGGAAARPCQFGFFFKPFC